MEKIFLGFNHNNPEELILNSEDEFDYEFDLTPYKNQYLLINWDDESLVILCKDKNRSKLMEKFVKIVNRNWGLDGEINSYVATEIIMNSDIYNERGGLTIMYINDKNQHVIAGELAINLKG